MCRDTLKVMYTSLRQDPLNSSNDPMLNVQAVEMETAVSFVIEVMYLALTFCSVHHHPFSDCPSLQVTSAIHIDSLRCSPATNRDHK